MSANCTRWMGFASTTAPMSSMIGEPFRAGSGVMMAGRSTPSGRPRTKIAPAITAPELPADTIAHACFDATSSKQIRIELSFFRRIAWPGWSCISTTSVAFRTSIGSAFPAW